MRLFPFGPTPLVAAAVAEPAMFTVVITGLSLVFFILVILIVVVLAEGSIFKSLDKRKSSQTDGGGAAKPQPGPVLAAAPAPVVQPGISPEVVAAISAAVHAASGGAYVLRTVTTVKKGRGQWGLAGVIQNTEPF